MPAEIVNLNKFRKARERAEQERKAEENRAKHGRTKADRTRDDDEQARRDRLLDDAKVTSGEPGTAHREEREGDDTDPSGKAS